MTSSNNATYLYTILCCSTEIDIYLGESAHCPECGSIFMAATQGESYASQLAVNAPGPWYEPLTSQERDDLYWLIRSGYRAEVGLISHDNERGLVSHSLIDLNMDTIELLADLARA